MNETLLHQQQHIWSSESNAETAAETAPYIKDNITWPTPRTHADDDVGGVEL